MTRPDAFPDVSMWFGPLDPLPPVAPGQVAGRRLDYPSGWNLLVSPRGEDAVPAGVLRALADECDLVRLAIETRKDQLAGLDWRIALRGGGGRTSDPRIASATSRLAYPDREHAWDEWVRLIVEDMLVLDAATIYPRRALDGSLWALDAIDGGTIKRVIDDWGRTPEPPFPAYQQILKGLPATDYTADQLLYLPRNPRTHRLYGFPPVEQILLTVNVALRRQAHRLEYYTEGSQPDAFFGVPADWTTEQLRQYQEYWDALLAGNTAQRRRMRFIHGAVQYIETKPAILKDEFDEWLARVVCFAFSISPAPFVRQLNRASAETQDRAALREGMAPLMRWLKRVVDRILGQVLGWPDLEFVWQDTTEQDPETQARIAVSLVGAGITTRNEARATLGLPPLQGGDALTTAGPAVPLAKAGFDPAEARDERGRWTTGGASERATTDASSIRGSLLQPVGGSENDSEGRGFLEDILNPGRELAIEYYRLQQQTLQRLDPENPLGYSLQSADQSDWEPTREDFEEIAEAIQRARDKLICKPDGPLPRGIGDNGGPALDPERGPAAELQPRVIGPTLPSEDWKWGWAERGFRIERARGGNLPPGFPVIDLIPNGIATSIKSIDLRAPTYQDPDALEPRLERYVEKLAEFNGARRVGTNIEPADIKGRTLDLVIPRGSITSSQREVIERVRKYAQHLANPVEIDVNEY